jgi:hypothetical protein
VLPLKGFDVTDCIVSIKLSLESISIWNGCQIDFKRSNTTQASNLIVLLTLLGRLSKGMGLVDDDPCPGFMFKQEEVGAPAE